MLISVIIPTFNRKEMLREAVESVIKQDWSEKEIIIVDDGSTDGTSADIFQTSYLHKSRNQRRYLREIPASAGMTGHSLHFIRTEHKGVSHARNVGIRSARGELIAFLDSDDLWLPGKLARQVKFFEENPDISICQTEEIWVRNGRRVNPRRIHKKYSGWIFEKCIPLCIVSPSAVMMRRAVFDDIGLFDEEMPACEDYDLWLRASLKYQIITLPEPLIIKRGGHADQLSRQWGLDIWRIRALKKILPEIKDTARAELVKRDIARRVQIVFNGARKRGKLITCYP